jgi:uncharacterized BrkB/YihY/UPF0761 family membrane protein
VTQTTNKWIALASCTARNWVSDNASTAGASLAFFCAFSIPPLLVIVLKTAGWIVGATAAYSPIGAQLNGLFGPYTANILLEAIKISQQAQGLVATVVSVVTLLIGATTAQRVVQGAQHLSPALGDRMMATKLLGRSVVLRELMPQDVKLAIDQLTRE